MTWFLTIDAMVNTNKSQLPSATAFCKTCERGKAVASRVQAFVVMKPAAFTSVLSLVSMTVGDVYVRQSLANEVLSKSQDRWDLVWLK